MFSVENKTEAGFNKIILKDSGSGTFAEIIPSCGAILYAFVVHTNNEWLNVIDSYIDEDDFIKNVTPNGFKSAKLSPFACRVKNAEYKFAGINYKLERFLSGNNALHGLLYNAGFSVISKKCTEEYAAVVLQYAYRGEDEGYSFYYDCLVSYRLERENVLHLSTTIVNKGEGLMPIQDGWHPYFTLGNNIDELQLEFQSKEKLEFDDELIPTGKFLSYTDFNSLQKIGNTYFDNCFTLNFAECQPLCVLRNPIKKIQIGLYPSNGYPYLQIYTPPHRKSISIENLSAAPDAFNNGMGLKTLAVAETIQFKTAYKITLLP